MPRFRCQNLQFHHRLPEKTTTQRVFINIWHSVSFSLSISSEDPKSSPEAFYSYSLLIPSHFRFTMPSNQAKAIPEPEWNQHKDEIIRLFSTGTMETLRQKMGERGFSAT
jgi:hypothetical protein